MEKNEKKDQQKLFAVGAGGLVTGIIGLVAGTAMAGPVAIGGGVALVIWGIVDLCDKENS
jgi:hypothetical protein